jgi:hypothetical protein
MEQKIKKAVFVFFILLLVLPALQFKFDFIKMKPLGGSYQFASRPNFIMKEFISLDYQKKYEKYLNDHIGLREFFLRSYNQVWFSLFRVVHANNVILGSNNCLYEINYIEDYTGVNFVGEKVIDEQLRKARFIQDTLKKDSIYLIILFAPGKASFYPENIPQKYLDKSQPKTNYKYYTSKCKKMGLNYIDMNSYFVSQKNKSPYPLYYPGGIHWSVYGMTVAFDSLCRYIATLQGAPLPEMVWDGVEISDTARETDNDIERGLNLLFDLPYGKYTYPLVHFIEKPNIRKPKVLAIADSYWWNIFGIGYTKQVFNGNSFWFYNQQAHDDWSFSEATTDTMDLLKETHKYNVVIMEATEANLFGFGYSYFDRLYDIYTGKGDIVMEQKKLSNEITFQEEVIRHDQKWLEVVKQKALAENIPIDTAIRQDAIYMVNQKHNK